MSLTFAHFSPRSGLLVYMDDIIACSATWAGHLRLLEDMFLALREAGLTLKPSKIQFGPTEVKYLGRIPTDQGIRIGQDRIRAIVDLPTPTTTNELRSLLGMVNFVRKFLPDLAPVIEPLEALISELKPVEQGNWHLIGVLHRTPRSLTSNTYLLPPPSFGSPILASSLSSMWTLVTWVYVVFSPIR